MSNTTHRDIAAFQNVVEPLSDAKTFRYKRPEKIAAGRGIAPLVRSDILLGAVQIFDDGGEQELHSHSNMDGFWFVLKGRVRFYGKDRTVIAEAGPHEGVFVPRNFAYWFEKVGEESLELLQVEAIDRRVKGSVTRYDADLPPGRADIFEPGGELIAADVQLTD